MVRVEVLIVSPAKAELKVIPRMGENLDEGREDISVLNITILCNSDVAVNACGKGYEARSSHIIEIGSKLTDLLVNSVVLLSDIDYIAAVLSVKDEEHLRSLGEGFEVTAIGIKSDLIEKDKAFRDIKNAKIRESKLQAALNIVVAKYTPILTLPFCDPLKLLSCELGKHSTFSAAGETEKASDHRLLPRISMKVRPMRPIGRITPRA